MTATAVALAAESVLAQALGSSMLENSRSSEEMHLRYCYLEQ